MSLSALSRWRSYSWRIIKTLNKHLAVGIPFLTAILTIIAFLAEIKAKDKITE